MNPNYLDFEQPIADLEAKIQELRSASTGPAVNIDAEVHALQDKLRMRTAQIFRDLTPWQVSQLARHPARPVHARLHPACSATSSRNSPATAPSPTTPPSSAAWAASTAAAW